MPPPKGLEKNTRRDVLLSSLITVLQLSKQCTTGGGGHAHAGSCELDDDVVFLLPLGLIWIEAQERMYEPGSAQTLSQIKRGERNETLGIIDAWAESAGV